MQPQSQSYIETIPKELGLELLERMTTEQVEKLLYNNPFLIRRYGEYLEERLEAETMARRAYNKRKQSKYGYSKKHQRNLNIPRAILLNPRATMFMNLPYRDHLGRGYYSVNALIIWKELFSIDNQDPDGLISLTPKEQDILGLPEKVGPSAFMEIIWNNKIEDVVEPPQEILDYLEEEERELNDMLIRELANEAKKYSHVNKTRKRYAT